MKKGGSPPRKCAVAMKKGSVGNNRQTPDSAYVFHSFECRPKN